MSINRRSFLRFAGGVFITLAASAPIASAQVQRRPNFIFVITDDQRCDALGVVQRELGPKANFPWFKTPNMDRLANEGARFRNAFVVQSLCSPSRANFLTGMYSHQHGITHNDQPFPDTLTTWATELSKNGYATGYFGKWHMGTQRERPGFATTFTFVGQGDYENCTILDNGKEVKPQGWVDDITTDCAISFIESRKTEPFAMVVGYKTPHDPRHPALRHKDLYRDSTFVRPENYEATPPFVDPAKKKPWRETSEDRLNFFRCLQGVDDNVGRLLDVLDRTGLAQDTMVVFVGDNGYYLGEHGLGDKRSLYEESIRIPLLVKYPRAIKAGTVIDAPALNIDFAPTLLELAGLSIPSTMQGRSWVPLFGGNTPADWRTSFLTASYVDPAYPDVTFESLAVRTTDAKLVVYKGHEDWTELYDLKADPLEMKNLARDPASSALLSRMQSEMARQKAQTQYRDVELPARPR